MKNVRLSNGVMMPAIGFGVFQIPENETERVVLDAIGVGYRKFDTAQAYYNEEGVGNAVAKCGVSRDELFLTTKEWITNAGEEKATRSIDESLRKLRTDYIDLLLIHQPFSDYPGTWRAMEKGLKAGKVRAIGLSNFYPDRFVDMAECAEIKPAVMLLYMEIARTRVLPKWGLSKDISRQWPRRRDRKLKSTKSNKKINKKYVSIIKS